MNLKRLTMIDRDMSILPFYLENHYYHVDPTGFDHANTTFDTLYTEMCTDTTNKLLLDALSQLLKSYIAFQNDLRNLAIDEHDFHVYMSQSRKQGDIQQYFELKEQFRYAIIAVMFFDDDTTVDDHDVSTTIENNSRETNVILNHHNPFADITIHNQSFIYPDADGKFQTLNFNVGYTMSKIEENDKYAIALQPDFKITKSHERYKQANSITMDNTLTSAMPDNQGHRQLMYI